MRTIDHRVKQLLLRKSSEALSALNAHTPLLPATQTSLLNHPRPPPSHRNQHTSPHISPTDPIASAKTLDALHTGLLELKRAQGELTLRQCLYSLRQVKKIDTSGKVNLPTELQRLRDKQGPTYGLVTGILDEAKLALRQASQPELPAKILIAASRTGLGASKVLGPLIPAIIQNQNKTSARTAAAALRSASLLSLTSRAMVTGLSEQFYIQVDDASEMDCLDVVLASISLPVPDHVVNAAISRVISLNHKPSVSAKCLNALLRRAQPVQPALDSLAQHLFTPAMVRQYDASDCQQMLRILQFFDSGYRQYRDDILAQFVAISRDQRGEPTRETLADYCRVCGHVAGLASSDPSWVYDEGHVQAIVRLIEDNAGRIQSVFHFVLPGLAVLAPDCAAISAISDTACAKIADMDREHCCRVLCAWGDAAYFARDDQWRLFVDKFLEHPRKEGRYIAPISVAVSRLITARPELTWTAGHMQQLMTAFAADESPTTESIASLIAACGSARFKADYEVRDELRRFASAPPSADRAALCVQIASGGGALGLQHEVVDCAFADCEKAVGALELPDLVACVYHAAIGNKWGGLTWRSTSDLFTNMGQNDLLQQEAVQLLHAHNIVRVAHDVELLPDALRKFVTATWRAAGPSRSLVDGAEAERLQKAVQRVYGDGCAVQQAVEQCGCWVDAVVGDDAVRVSIMLGATDQYYINEPYSKQTVPLVQQQDKLLGLHGFKVARVPFWEWREVEGKQAEDQYVKQAMLAVGGHVAA